MERNLPVLAPLRHSREGMFILGLITFIAFLGLTNSWYLLMGAILLLKVPIQNCLVFHYRSLV